MLGAEFFLNGIGTLLGHIEAQGLENIRIHAGDARPLLAALPAASMERVFLLFPDPWPKARHARRRFICPQNLDQLARVMMPGGELRIASDDAGYQAWTLQHLTARRDFEWLARGPANWRRRPEDWPPTRYEDKALKAGRKPAYLRFRRRPSSKG